MADKRRDNKKRILYVGESQRKDGTYMYRYTDMFGVRQCVYAPTLNELRQKEEKIQKDLEDGIVTVGGNTKVEELLDSYLNNNRKWKDSTRTMKEFYIKRLKTYPFSCMAVKDVKVSHVKKLFLQMNEDGTMKSSLRIYLGILKVAFEIAVEDDFIRKNPCNINLNFLPDEETDKNILTLEQEDKFIEFIRNDPKFNYYADIFIIMVETGIRIGEMCGLTLSDIDLKNRILHINHQLCRDYKSKTKMWYISSTKTKNSVRDIYISDRAYNSFVNLIKKRNEETVIEPILDGYSKFLLTTQKKCKIVTNSMVGYALRSSVEKFNKEHEEQIPHLSLHSLRHTFCTRMAEKGVSANSLQYFMGHAKIATTMDVYTHWGSGLAINEMQQMNKVN